jgi:hypothetical protein
VPQNLQVDFAFWLGARTDGYLLADRDDQVTRERPH